MFAEIISIGDEILIGQIVNTNAAFLGEGLSKLGIRVQKISNIGDQKSEIISTLANALANNDVVFVTGGLGPTHDDVTRGSMIDFFETHLVKSEVVYDDIKVLLAQRKRAFIPSYEDQAMVPATANIIRNRYGTAPGYHFKVNDKHVFVTPGVPVEMKGMWDSYIKQTLSAISNIHFAVATFQTTGIAESVLSEKLSGIESILSPATLAYLPSQLGVRLRIMAFGNDISELEACMERLRIFIYEKVAEYIYGEGDDSLEGVIGQLLRDRKLTISVSESCTGGLIADKITNIPGSSSYFDRGFITYSDKSKTELLGVSSDLIFRHGAVSEEVACAMAEGVRQRSNASIGLSTTGIAGPSGGSDDKPIGLVWIAISTQKQTSAFRYYFGTDRIITKARSAQSALDLVRRLLLSLPLRPAI